MNNNEAAPAPTDRERVSSDSVRYLLMICEAHAAALSIMRARMITR